MNALRLGATQSLIDAIDVAKSVHLEAYVLSNPHVIDALERAAKRGAKVDVALCGDPRGDGRIDRDNTKTINRLQHHGIPVNVELGEGRGSLHAKAAIVDGT